MIKKKYLIGIILIIIFALFAGWSFRSAMTPYVSFAEAKDLTGQVQVMGYFYGPEARYDSATGDLTFQLQDKEGTKANIVFAGAKPENFDEAESIVVIGQYQENVFRAQRLLLKCPSKYEKEQD